MIKYIHKYSFRTHVNMLICSTYINNIIILRQNRLWQSSLQSTGRVQPIPTILWVLRGSVNPVVLIGQSEKLELLDRQIDRPCVRNEAVDVWTRLGGPIIRQVWKHDAMATRNERAWSSVPSSDMRNQRMRVGLKRGTFVKLHLDLGLLKLLLRTSQIMKMEQCELRWEQETCGR